MNLSKLFKRETAEPAAKNGGEALEHLAPEEYFTAARVEDLRATLGNLRTVEVKNISVL